MVKLWQLLALVVLITMISGCCSGCNFSSGMAKSTFTLHVSEFKETEFSLDSGKTFEYSVTADGGPVDVYILDDTNYTDYKTNGNTWEAIFSDTADPTLSGTFTATKSDTYYFVVENAGDDDIDVTWDLKW